MKPYKYWAMKLSSAIDKDVHMVDVKYHKKCVAVHASYYVSFIAPVS